MTGMIGSTINDLSPISYTPREEHAYSIRQVISPWCPKPYPQITVEIICGNLRNLRNLRMILISHNFGGCATLIHPTLLH